MSFVVRARKIEHGVIAKEFNSLPVESASSGFLSPMSPETIANTHVTNTRSPSILAILKNSLKTRSVSCRDAGWKPLPALDNNVAGIGGIIDSREIQNNVLSDVPEKVAISCSRGLFFGAEETNTDLLTIDYATSPPALYPVLHILDDISKTRGSIRRSWCISSAHLTFLCYFWTWCVTKIRKHFLPLSFGGVGPSVSLSFGAASAGLCALGDAAICLANLSANLFAHELHSLTTGRIVREGRVSGDAPIVGNPFLLGILPLRDMNLLKEYQSRFFATSKQTANPVVPVVLLFCTCGKQVTAKAFLWSVGFANVANVFCEWINQAVDVGNGTIFLRLGILLKQVAHGILSIVQRSAALNYNNSTMLEAA